MVTVISETIGTIHFVLTCVIMAGMLGLIILLDYFKKTEKKNLIWSIVSVLVLLGCTILGFSVVETLDVIANTADGDTSLAITIIGILTGGIFVIIIGAIVILESLKKPSTKKGLYSIIFTILLLIGIVLITAVIAISFVLPGPISNNSLHIGSIIGFPALILVSVGTILVIFDEPKFVIYHGLTAGGSWILTLLNVLLLFTLSFEQMSAYSGIIHTIHILCGAVGLASGFLSALFGLSGQRTLAKLTGYITLGCWWTAYMLATFIVDVV
jgi:hypothetical protein